MKRFYDNFPLCCPSRATLLTGQYAHNHHVLSNTRARRRLRRLQRAARRQLPAALAAGAPATPTGYIGKYLNEYAEPDEYGTVPTDVPKGWDDWHVLAPSRAQYFGYTLNQNGVLTQYTEDEEDYSTDVFTTKAKRFIRRNAPSSRPVLPRARLRRAARRRRRRAGTLLQPRRAVPRPATSATLKGKFKGTLPPSFNEADVSDKPSPIAEQAAADPGPDHRHPAQAPLRLGVAARGRRERRRAARRDQARRRSRRTPTSSSSPTTASCAASTGSATTSATSTRSRRGCPFIARGPGIPRDESSDDVVVNADLTSTILELSGATPGLTQDGQSLMPSLLEPDARARPRDPVRGLRRRADPRRAHLALPLHRVGRRQNPVLPRARALRHLRRPLPAQQPRRRPQLRGRRRRARRRARPADRLRRRELPRGADRPAHASPPAATARTAAASRR